MLSFNALSERKTKIKMNPKIQDVQECPDEMDKPKKRVCTACMGSGQKGGMECTQCEGKGFYMDSENDMEEGYKGYSKGGEVEPPKERLKTDRNMFNIPKDEQDAARERLKAKAAAKRKQLNKEENAYVSQEEVSEESNQESDSETKLLTFGQFTEGYGAPGHNPGSGEKSVARAKALMDKKGQKGAPGLNAMAAAKKEHEARRGVKEGLSIDDQMKISRDAAKDRNPKPDHKAIRGKMLKKPLPKDTRTDAQKMTDATGPRPGSRYRGD